LPNKKTKHKVYFFLTVIFFYFSDFNSQRDIGQQLIKLCVAFKERRARTLMNFGRIPVPAKKAYINI